MTQYARITDTVVVELFTPPDGVPISDCFAPEIAAQFAPVPADEPVELGWTYDGTTFAPPVPVPPSADQEVIVRRATGIATTSTGTPAASATYPLDGGAVALLGSFARDVASGLGLPDDQVPPPGGIRTPRAGGVTVEYPDIDGITHALTAEQVTALYTAQRDVLATLSTQAGVMDDGGSPAWPDQTATIP
jgi:hypothetical protein